MLDPSLTALELDVIAALSMSRVTASAVTLAADLWRTNDNWTAFDVEPIVTLVIRSLADQNLVTFFEKIGWSFPLDIRLTPDGWALAGYPTETVESGTPSRHRSRPHPNDPTDYRNHPYHARKEPIYTEDFPTHRAHFPHHVHDYGEAFPMHNPGPTIQPVEGEDGTRRYLKITPDIEAQILAAKNRLGAVGYQDVADDVGLPERTVKYVLSELPRLRRAKHGDDVVEGSLRERIVLTLEAITNVKDVAELQRILGRADDKHNIVHVLHNLHAGGIVDFREAQGHDHPTDIHLHKRQSKRQRTRQAEREVGTIPKGNRGNEVEPVEMPSFVADRIHESVDITNVAVIDDIPGIDDDDFPLLDELIAREAKRQHGDETALAYVAAATAIEKVDPAMAADLMAKAKALDVPYPSPLEREYLRYAVKNAKGESND